jgi:hypothetical protein
MFSLVLMRRKLKVLLTLDSSQADTAGGGVDQHPITLFDTGALDERAVARRCRDEEAGGVLEGPALGDGQDSLLGGVDVLGVGALRGAKDAGADGVQRLGLGVLGDGDDNAGEFDAGGPGKGCRSVSDELQAKRNKKGRKEERANARGWC